MTTSTPAKVIPEWINDEFFLDIGFKKLSLEENGYKAKVEKVVPIGGAGENYTSNMHRVAVKYATKDNKEKDLHTIVKTMTYSVPEIKIFNLFGREVNLYDVVIPRYKELWKNNGVDVDFAPCCYKTISAENDTMVLEDISVRSYSVADRRKGLDLNYAHIVLDKLARFHAASAVDFEKNGPLNEDLDRDMFKVEMKPLFESFFAAFKYFDNAVVEIFPTAEAEIYLQKLKRFRENGFEITLDLIDKKHRRFVVLNHGDMWCNNLMFHYDDEEKPNDVLFIDFQNSIYMTPAFDLFYFLISSLNIDIKVNKFHELIYFYHEKLAKYLEQLGYPKKPPTLKDIHQELLTNSLMSMTHTLTIMSVVLLDPTSDASMEAFLGDGAEAEKFKKSLYDNPRYRAHVSKLLPFLNLQGWLDVSNF